MPARIACATLLNLGLSDGRRLIVDMDRVKVIVNQLRTSFGTESGSISERAPSSSSINRLGRSERRKRASFKRPAEKILRFILMHSFENVRHIIEILDQIFFSNENITLEGSDDRP